MPLKMLIYVRALLCKVDDFKTNNSKTAMQMTWQAIPKIDYTIKRLKHIIESNFSWAENTSLVVINKSKVKNKYLF